MLIIICHVIRDAETENIKVLELSNSQDEYKGVVKKPTGQKCARSRRVASVGGGVGLLMGMERDVIRERQLGRKSPATEGQLREGPAAAVSVRVKLPEQREESGTAHI